MNRNQQLIKKFYDCFDKKDWRGMAGCYHEDVFFYDPVFQNLEGPQVSAMWEMLLRNAKDLTIAASNITADEEQGTCQWTANYTFSATGRPVVNSCKAHFTFKDGKITEHQDEFSFWNWSRQALGIPGLLFGGTSFLQRKVRRQARQNLDKFIASKTTTNS